MLIEDKIKSAKARTIRLGMVAMTFFATSMFALESRAEDWLAELKISSRNSTNEFSDSVSCGVKDGTTRNYDAGVGRDVLDASYPSGVNTFLETDDTPPKALLRSYIGQGPNRSFRVVIEYIGHAPTSTTATVTCLPTNERWAMLTFSNSVYTGWAGVYYITNGAPINIGTKVRGLYVTPAPLCRDISIKQNAQNPTNSDVYLAFDFYCYNATSRLAIVSSTNLMRGVTNGVGYAKGTNGTYTGTISNLPSRVLFFEALLKK